MFEYNSTTAPFLITGFMSAMILAGTILRRYIPFLRKSLLPASVIGGLIGFVLINIGIIPIEQSVFETVSFHLLNLSFMSISLATTRKVVKNDAEPKNEKNVRGGLWLALMWGATISVQIVVAGIISLIFGSLGGGFHPLYGMLSAHGFAQGPVQALSMARTWISSLQGDNTLADAVQIGLFFAMIGYLSALLVGVPICNRFFKKGLAAHTRSDSDVELERGIYRPDGQIPLGNQTTHRASLDTLSFHIALMLGIYFLTYLLVSLVDPNHDTMIYQMMFVWAILVTNIVVAILRKCKADHLVDAGVQTSITNFCTDFALVACMMSVSAGVVVKYLVPLIAVSVGVVAVTAALIWVLAKKTGKYAAERFVTVFGISTGTAITGLLLLRILDPQGETPVTKEVVWWNIFQMFTGMISISLAPFAAIWGWKAWMGINAVIALVMLVITYLVGRNIAKPARVKIKATEIKVTE